MNFGANLDAYSPDAQGFAGGHGDGGSLEDLQNLNKALDAQSITGRETANLTTAGGAPLKVESLEKTLKILTFSEKAIKLWQTIPKKSAFNTVEEFNQLSSYGQDRGGFNMEGELPLEEDSTYVRRAQLVKYMGVTKSVTHQMTLVNTTVGSVMERQIKDGTLWILRKMDKALTKADASLIPQEFNGLYAQHQQNDVFSDLNSYYTSETIVDCRGGTLSEANIEKAAEGIVENFGVGTQLYAPPKVLSKFVSNFYGNKFIPINTAAISAGQVGQNVQSFESQYGTIGLNWDVFMNPDAPKTTVSPATSVNAPLAPTAGTVTPVAATVTNTMWDAATAGTYFYGVTAVNRFGESALTPVSGTIATIVNGGAVDLAFTATASVNAATAFTIYRSNKGAASAAAATFYPIFTISTTQLAAGYDGAAALSVRDMNRILPNTSQAFLIQNDSETLEFAQLAPLMKMDLAVTGPAFRFMMLLYGTPLLYAPKRMVKFINVAGV